MIKGLEQRIRIPRLGRIGLGVKKVAPTGKEHPTEVSYFVVPEMIAKHYGEQPIALPVRFPFDQPERVLHSIFYVRRQGKTKTRQCDGECFTEIGRGGQDVEGKCRKPDNIYASCPDKCRATAKLAVVIPKTPLGIWEVPIGGLQRIADVLAELRHFERAMGPLSRFLFTLVREPTEEQYVKDDGSSAWRTGYPVHVRTDFTVEEVMALRGEAMPEPKALSPALHEEDVIPDDEGDETPDPEAQAEEPLTATEIEMRLKAGAQTKFPRFVPSPAALAELKLLDEVSRPGGSSEGVPAPVGEHDPKAVYAGIGSQHDDPAPPQAAAAKITGDGSGLLEDECVDLAKKLDVDAPTARAWLTYVLAQEGNTLLGATKADFLTEKILWLKEVAQSPVKSAAAKAAIRAGATKAGSPR